MAKVTIQLYKVPPEFSKQARHVENICQHLYRKVANGEAIRDKEIGSIGSQQDVIKPGEYYSMALCVDCTYREKDVRFEIVPWPVQGGPIEEFALSKDAMKK